MAFNLSSSQIRQIRVSLTAKCGSSLDERDGWTREWKAGFCFMQFWSQDNDKYGPINLHVVDVFV